MTSPKEATGLDDLDRMALGDFGEGGSAPPPMRRAPPAAPIPPTPTPASAPASPIPPLDQSRADDAAPAAAPSKRPFLTWRSGPGAPHQVEDATFASPQAKAQRRWALPSFGRRGRLAFGGSLLLVLGLAMGYLVGRSQALRVAAPESPQASFGEPVQVRATAAASAVSAGDQPESASVAASAAHLASQQEAVPPAVLAAASAALPPVSSLPPAVDERKAGAPKPTAAPAAAQQAAKDAPKEGLIALGDDAEKAAPNVAAPTPAASAAAVQPLRQAASAVRVAASAPLADTKVVKAPVETPPAKRLKYGAMGITALTGNAVVVVGPQGQRAIQVGQALPDGSILQAVDAKSHRFTTNQASVQLD